MKCFIRTVYPTPMNQITLEFHHDFFSFHFLGHHAINCISFFFYSMCDVVAQHQNIPHNSCFCDHVFEAINSWFEFFHMIYDLKNTVIFYSISKHGINPISILTFMYFKWKLFMSVKVINYLIS